METPLNNLHHPIFHDYQTCEDPDCEECTRLIEEGFIMGCDGDGPDGKGCNTVGSTASDGWTLCEDGAVLCDFCASQPGVVPMAFGEDGAPLNAEPIKIVETPPTDKWEKPGYTSWAGY